MSRQIKWEAFSRAHSSARAGVPSGVLTQRSTFNVQRSTVDEWTAVENSLFDLRIEIVTASGIGGTDGSFTRPWADNLRTRDIGGEFAGIPYDAAGKEAGIAPEEGSSWFLVVATDKHCRASTARAWSAN